MQWHHVVASEVLAVHYRQW